MANSNFAEVISTCTDFMSTKLEMTNINEPLLVAIAEGLGPAIYHPDASLVACSDKSETDRVKTNFLIGTLQLADTKVLDEAISAVCKQMGQSNRKKYRVVFYYLLLQHFGLEAKYLKPEAPAEKKATIKKAKPKSVIAETVHFESPVEHHIHVLTTHAKEGEVHHDLLHSITQIGRAHV